MSSRHDEELRVEQQRLLDEAAAPQRQHRRAATVCALGCAGVALAVLVFSLNVHRANESLTADGVVESDGDCILLWTLSPSDMVSQGVGSRMLVMAMMYEKFTAWNGCPFAMWNQDVALWKNSWGLTPPATMFLDGKTYGGWLSALLQTPDRVLDPYFRVGLLGPWPEASVANYIGKPSSLLHVYQDFAGCWNTFDTVLWNVFKARMVSYTRPFSGPYLGLHVRHGDKISEGHVISFQQVMTTARSGPWSQWGNAFVATDDSSVIQSEMGNYPDWNFRFTDYSRTWGGEPAGGHDNSQGANEAVISDILGLANADALVGSFNSNLFKLAYLLNYLRRKPSEREHQWCWDEFTLQDCSSRHSFVNSFVRNAQGSAAWMTTNLEHVADCWIPE